MRNPNCAAAVLFASSVLLRAGLALAGDEPHGARAPAPQAVAKPGQPAPAAVEGAQLPRTYTDRELTDVEKAALAKRRLASCRLHPGTCEQGAKDVPQAEAKPKGIEPPKPAVEGNPK